MLSPSTCTDALWRWLLLSLAALAASGALGQSIEKALMPGAVIEGHAKYEMECTRCHQRFDKAAQEGLCRDCHKDVARDMAAERRFHGRLKEKDCRQCHEEHKGRGASIARFDKDKFDHNLTEFPLREAHADPAVECESCHKPKAKYRDAPRLCNNCHKKIDNEKGHKGKLGVLCETCHSEKNWKQARFDHEKTKFPIVGGRHAEVKCKGCHIDLSFKPTPLTCIGCHKKDDQGKGHKGNYGTKCDSCHDDKRDWKESIFDHGADTPTLYVLKGKHKETKCNKCHLPEKGPLYKVKLPVKCVACHKADDDKKGHRGTLGDKCQNCHSERDWKTTNFDHDDTKFALRDKHRDAKCDACHKEGVSGRDPGKLKLDVACLSCHRKNDDEKGHKGRYGPKCETCHGAKDWKSSLFRHDRETKYPLLGKHALVKCDACHLVEKGAIYKSKLDITCIACHRKDDKHKNQLGEKCEGCHNEKRWDDAPFNHNKARYPLTGAHIKVECKKCHASLTYRDAKSTCIACHTKEDKHRKAFGIKCEACHYTGTWKSWDFDHEKTRFRIDGAHDKVACYDCHIPATAGQARYRAAERACIACHQKDNIHDWGLSGACERCHVTSDWKKLRK